MAFHKRLNNQKIQLLVDIDHQTYENISESSTCNWGFDDFRYWGSDDCFYTCGGGTNQAKGSPINIVTASVVANSDTIVDTDNDGTGDMDIGFITDMQSEEYKQVVGAYD